MSTSGLGGCVKCRRAILAVAQAKMPDISHLVDIIFAVQYPGQIYGWGRLISASIRQGRLCMLRLRTIVFFPVGWVFASCLHACHSGKQCVGNRWSWVFQTRRQMCGNLE